VRDRTLALAVLAAAIAVALVVPLPLAAAALVLPLAALVIGPRVELDRLGQAAATVGAMVAGVVVPRLLGGAPDEAEATTLSEPATLFALPVLGVAAMRALLVAPRWGAPVTLAAALVALTAAGRARPGIAYPLLAAAFLTLGFLALGRADPGRAPPRRAGGRHVVVTALAAILAAGLTVGATATLPPLQDAAMARLLLRFRAPRSGFSDRVRLGALGGLLEDDGVVMRLRGDSPPPLLRGAVLSGYAGGVWDVERRLPIAEIVEVDARAPAGPGVIEIEIAHRHERYFLPLDARDVTASSGFYSRNALGVYSPVRGFHAKRLWFRTGGDRPVWPPAPLDGAVPPALGAELRPLLAAWGALEGAPRQRLERIEARLGHDYRYSLEFTRELGRDPIADFLLRSRAGHCEYFAGAMAVLGRLAGVPTRVGTGYRGAERSPWGYAVVRQRHAHAWVEAWVEGRWVTFDPTPPDALRASTPSQTPALSAFFDRLATGWESVDDWLARRTPFELSLALVVGVGAWLLYRSLGARRRRAAPAAPVEPPLPGFVALDRALGRRGLTRAPGETLHRFTERVAAAPELGPPERAAIAAHLRAYAELRYAGRGEAAALDRELAASARRI